MLNFACDGCTSIARFNGKEKGGQLILFAINISVCQFDQERNNFYPHMRLASTVMIAFSPIERVMGAEDFPSGG